MNNIELLAPAKDFEKLKIALLYGADAIYVGGKSFSLRANAANFTDEELKQAVIYTHNLHKKIYVTVNIILHNSDIPPLKKYLQFLSSINVDAIIVSDIYIIDLIKENNIPLEIHLSTQASVLNHQAATFYKSLGVKRIVLAREASKEDIVKIKQFTNLDLECFIHGAMCTSFSGRCVMSNVLTNRDANRGLCAQICRWTFDNSNNEVFSMSSKDLNLIPYIKDMIDIGVNSFKVEGRMRGIYYLATVIGTYRKLIDKITNNTLTSKESNYYLAILNRCANRESTPQFYQKLPTKDEQYFLGRVEVSNQDFLGLVLAYDNINQLVTIEQRNYFQKGTIVEFFGPNLEPFTYKINKIYDENDNEITEANHPKMIIKLPISVSLTPFDIMRLKVIDKDTYLL